MARMHVLRLHQTKQGSILLYRTEREIDRAELEAIS